MPPTEGIIYVKTEEPVFEQTPFDNVTLYVVELVAFIAVVVCVVVEDRNVVGLQA